MVRNETDPLPRGRVHALASLAVSLATLTLAGVALSDLAHSPAISVDYVRSGQVVAEPRARAAQAREPGIDPALPPPTEPPLRTLSTRATTRLWGATPFEKAVAVSQHLWTAAIPLSKSGGYAVPPGEGNWGATDGLEDPGDRPHTVLLVDVDEPLAAISATPLLQLPVGVALLFVNGEGIPAVTLEELKRIRPARTPATGQGERAEVIVVGGAAANPQVLKTLSDLELKVQVFSAESIYQLANRIDAWFGELQNPDMGVPAPGGEAWGVAGGYGEEGDGGYGGPGSGIHGGGSYDVLIGSSGAWSWLLPATHWVAHRPGGLLWVTTNSIPGPTLEALKRRKGQARIYVFGGPEQVSRAVVRKLADYGAVVRVDGRAGEGFAERAPDGPGQKAQLPAGEGQDGMGPDGGGPDCPSRAALAFARMWDPVGRVGWNVNSPGHGFTVVNPADWQSAVASAALSRSGYAAPLLFAQSRDALPWELEQFFHQMRPTAKASPIQAVPNMTWVLGDYRDISWPLQARIDHLTGFRDGRGLAWGPGRRPKQARDKPLD